MQDLGDSMRASPEFGDDVVGQARLTKSCRVGCVVAQSYGQCDAEKSLGPV